MVIFPDGTANPYVTRYSPPDEDGSEAGGSTGRVPVVAAPVVPPVPGVPAPPPPPPDRPQAVAGARASTATSAIKCRSVMTVLPMSRPDPCVRMTPVPGLRFTGHVVTSSTTTGKRGSCGRCTAASSAVYAADRGSPQRLRPVVGGSRHPRSAAWWQAPARAGAVHGEHRRTARGDGRGGSPAHAAR